MSFQPFRCGSAEVLWDQTSWTCRSGRHSPDSHNVCRKQPIAFNTSHRVTEWKQPLPTPFCAYFLCLWMKRMTAYCRKQRQGGRASGVFRPAATLTQRRWISLDLIRWLLTLAMEPYLCTSPIDIHWIPLIWVFYAECQSSKLHSAGDIWLKCQSFGLALEKQLIYESRKYPRICRPCIKSGYGSKYLWSSVIPMLAGCN